MTLHLVIFNLFLIDSIVYVFSVIFLYNRDTRSAEIACQVITDVKSVSYFAVFMFLAYLMLRFSNPPKEKVLPRLIALRQWHCNRLQQLDPSYTAYEQYDPTHYNFHDEASLAYFFLIWHTLYKRKELFMCTQMH